MNNAQARSSAHYDAQHNLLCKVAGSKQGALRQLSEMAVLFSFVICRIKISVTSYIAVNCSSVPNLLLQRNDMYAALLFAAVIFLSLGWHNTPFAWSFEHNNDHSLDQACQTKDLKGKEQQYILLLYESEPCALYALHELVALVHDRVNASDQNQAVLSTSTNVIHSCSITFQHNFPRTLEALILHLLSPVGAEVLMLKFDEIDQQKTKEDRNKFCQVFYGGFDNQFAAMNATLNGKVICMPGDALTC
ncbi:hypothetical protein PTKIN_Ptkin15bG0107800 [Pterospermum kingtungense]